MAHVISEECIKCAACVDECPTDAISEGEDYYLIDADECIDCSICVSACPVDAINEG